MQKDGGNTMQKVIVLLRLDSNQQHESYYAESVLALRAGQSVLPFGTVRNARGSKIYARSQNNSPVLFYALAGRQRLNGLVYICLHYFVSLHWPTDDGRSGLVWFMVMKETFGDHNAQESYMVINSSVNYPK